jgi:LDH2 family malate/lactate/ureidoglycolate dehydrogenase
MGFVNYSGGGRKVAPLGGTTGRWATNPLVLACPAPPGPAVVVDMSTSAVAEGTVRAALLAGEKLADGLLRGDDGRWINDPAQLYTEPPGAALAPLGGPAEHKGHALSAFVELMAGVVAGSGHVGAPRAFGNGGLFVSFPVDGLGKTPAEVGEAVVLLEEHLRQSPLAPGRATPRLPGRAVAHSSRSDLLRVPGDVWRAVGELAGYATVGGGEP